MRPGAEARGLVAQLRVQLGIQPVVQQGGWQEKGPKGMGEGRVLQEVGPRAAAHPDWKRCRYSCVGWVVLGWGSPMGGRQEPCMVSANSLLN